LSTILCEIGSEVVHVEEIFDKPICSLFDDNFAEEEVVNVELYEEFCLNITQIKVKSLCWSHPVSLSNSSVFLDIADKLKQHIQTQVIKIVQDGSTFEVIVSDVFKVERVVACQNYEVFG
jgi:hypothetical protein